MSSFGSSQSQKSGDTFNSGGSGASGASFHTNKSSNSSGSEPRVYHIPISIEPRDGSNSSGYTSEGNPNNEQPLSRSSSHSSGNGIGSGGQLRAERRSFSPSNNVSEKTESKNDKKEPISQIPVEVKSEPKQTSVSPLKESTENKSNDPKPLPKTKPKPKSGPFVTRIPVVNQSVIPPQKDESSPELNRKCDPKGVPNIDSLERIDGILDELQKYEKQINEFEGTTDDKNYRYLDEMLTRLMIKLDTIETFGREDIRKARKSAVLIVNKYITLLEQRVTRTQPKLQTKDVVKDEAGSAPTDKPEAMQISTPEPIEQLKDNNQEVTVNGSQTGSSEGKNQSKSQTNEKPNESENPTPNQRKETAV